MPMPSAGQYDPVMAQIMKPVYDGEAEPTAEGTLFIERHIRFPRARTAMELGQQGGTTSMTSVYLRMRDDEMTRKVRSNMWIIHRDTRYDFVGHQPGNYMDGELEFIVQSTGFTA